MNERLRRFREEIRNNNIDGVLIHSDTNRNYLTGFTGNESYIIITYDKAIFITDSRYTEQAKHEVIDFEVKEYKEDIISYIAQIIDSLQIKNLGFEENHIIFSKYEDLNNKLSHCKLVKLNGIIEKLRSVKDDREIENIEKAAQISDEGFTHILNFIKPGVTEKEIALELEFFMRSKGASALAFPTIAASGKRSSLPHGTATDKIIEKGDILTLDFGCVYNGYCSDMTRTVILGKATDKQKDIYYTVLEANERALEYIKPGISGEEADKVARDFIAHKGYGEYFGHGLGHGVGMDIHELPRISKKGTELLKEGMVITDEPGIYIPDFGGVRIEELVIVTNEGCRVLSKSNKQLIELV